jgi:hypothetical protein
LGLFVAGFSHGSGFRGNEVQRRASFVFWKRLYDLVTNPGTVRYLVNHLNLPQNRVAVREYESGHMPYLGEKSADALEKDLRRFTVKHALRPDRQVTAVFLLRRERSPALSSENKKTGNTGTKRLLEYEDFRRMNTFRRLLYLRTGVLPRIRYISL